MTSTGGSGWRDLRVARLSRCVIAPSQGGPRIGAIRGARLKFAEVIEDAHDHGALGDERDELHAVAAAPAAQWVDLLDA